MKKFVAIGILLLLLAGMILVPVAAARAGPRDAFLAAERAERLKIFDAQVRSMKNAIKALENQGKDVTELQEILNQYTALRGPLNTALTKKDHKKLRVIEPQIFSLRMEFWAIVQGMGGAPEPQMNIVETLAADDRFETLVTAVVAAGLDEALAGEGPFTVFAPTDDAFAALPPGLLEDLLADPTGDLTQILLYHAASGNLMAADIIPLDSVTTLQGSDITIEVVGGGVVLNGNVNVIETDIECSNGVIHVIDAVLLPPEPLQNIVETLAADDRFETLVTAVLAAGLDEALAGPGPFTVFAPTDDAFAVIPPEVLAALLADPTGDLTQILLYHVASGKVMATDVVLLDSVTTLQGSDITIEVVGGGVVLNGNVNVIETDIECSNGVIHVIDAVLIPTLP